MNSTMGCPGFFTGKISISTTTPPNSKPKVFWQRLLDRKEQKPKIPKPCTGDLLAATRFPTTAGIVSLDGSQNLSGIICPISMISAAQKCLAEQISIDLIIFRVKSLSCEVRAIGWRRVFFMGKYTFHASDI